MYKTWFALAGLAAAGLGVMVWSGRGAQGQTPGQGLPGSPSSSSLPAAFLQSGIGPAAPPANAGLPYGAGGIPPGMITPEMRQAQWDQLLREEPDINQDIAVTPAQGLWMICITSYTGPDAPHLARRMVEELRGRYRLPAFVFNYGAEQRRYELDRVRKEVEKKRLEMQSRGITSVGSIRVRYENIPIQCAVLIGGYRDDAAAERELKKIKKIQVGLEDLDRLPRQYDRFIIPPRSKGGKDTVEIGKVNPFMQAFLVRNPSIATDRPGDGDRMDLALLKRLNADEKFSLLKCPRPYTLVVKQFQLPTMVQGRSASNTFWEKIGLVKSMSDDAAAKSATSLAEYITKCGWQAYVLHTKFHSLVTVGAYDSPEDPRLLHDQHAIVQSNQRLDPRIQLMPRPMPVPR